MSWQYLFLLRFQLLSAIALVTLPLVARYGARALLGNLLVVSARDVFWITAFALLAGMAVVFTATLVIRHGPARFGGERLRLPPRLWRWRHLLGLVLALPIVLAVLIASYRQGALEGGWHLVAAVGAALGGAAITLSILYCAAWLRELLVPEGAAPSGLLVDAKLWGLSWARQHGRVRRRRRVLERPLGRMARRLGPGFCDPEKDVFRPGHVAALTIMMVTFTFYAAVGLLSTPGSSTWPTMLPALAYVLILFMLATWGLSALAFFFDRFRAPVLLLLLLFNLLTYAIWRADHYYPVTPHEAPPSPSLGPREALLGWLERQPTEDPKMVLVAASGGGITAAAWTMEVLTGLEEDLGPRFTRSLAAISSVSGGSAGSLFYLSNLQSGVERLDRLEGLREAASASSLRASAWGIVYPDLWRFLTPPVAQFWKHRDRAWALEQVWRRKLGEVAGPEASDRTLRDLRAKILRGELPVPIFNTTVAETGDLLKLTPVDSPLTKDVTLASPYKGFFDWYPHFDMPLVTAARLSATFPWVSPIARPDLDEKPFHLADGGYFDNFGVTSLVEWLEAMLPELQGKVRRVLVLQVLAFGSTRDKLPSSRRQAEDDEAQPVTADRGWIFSTLGPLVTLSNVRTSTQLARNPRELQLLRARWCAEGVEIETVALAPDMDGPLSWKLTERQRKDLHAAWRNALNPGGRAADEIEQIRAFFDGPPSDRCPAPSTASAP